MINRSNINYPPYATTTIILAFHYLIVYDFGLETKIVLMGEYKSNMVEERMTLTRQHPPIFLSFLAE